MWHVVPVDRQPRAANVRAAREADAATVRQLAKFILPIRSRDDPINTLSEANAPNAKIVRGYGVRLDEMFAAHVYRIDAKLFGNLVDLDLERKTRLRCAVSSL